MTKTESAHLTAQTVLIESAEQASKITDTDTARTFVDAWHRKNFPTDRTFSRYIMADTTRGSHLAGDFAWQLAKALESVEARLAATTQASTAQGGELAKPSVERSELANCSSQSMIAQASTAQAEPTDISRRLRDCIAQNVVPFPADVLAAADEIERYYGGMMAWKQTAEKKDRDWNEARMARANDRCAALLDAERFRWIEKNCRTEGGGHGFTVFVPVDHEDIGCGIDEAIRSAGDTGSGE